jgi:hypothetical protein
MIDLTAITCIMPMSACSGGHATTLRIWEDAGVDLEDLRLAVYRSFARTGRPPRADDLAERLTLDVATVRARLARTRPCPPPRSRPGRPDRHGTPVLRRAAGLRGHGPADAVVGRLRLGLLRTATAAAGRGRGPRVHQMPSLALVRTPGTSAPNGHRTATRSPTFSCPPRRCGMTSSTRAGTSACSAPKSALTHGAERLDPRAATSWIFARCGGSPPTGTTDAWTAATSGESRKRRRSTCEARDSRARSGACDPPSSQQ